MAQLDNAGERDQRRRSVHVPGGLRAAEAGFRGLAQPGVAEQELHVLPVRGEPRRRVCVS